MTPSEKKRVALRNKRVAAARDKLQTKDKDGVSRRTALGKAADKVRAKAKPRSDGQSKPNPKKSAPKKKKSVIKTIQDRKKTLKKLSDM